MKKLSLHIRWQINEKLLAGLSEHRIAKHLGVSRSTVHRVYHCFEQYGCAESLPSLYGRPRIFSCDDMRYLETLLKEKVDCLIWRAIHRLGYTHKQLAKPAQERIKNWQW
ncbi:hypothetical protein C1645_823083 [Glomus cerebriforme]|uniref:Homeodomain-like protein n=1 Tax=Glomus cerebriforme TaxID=658196 RepID=A0A397T3E4_9GLOM|nr:hypothetical protein C1645_823083 [Glomus cerebriforme]